MAPSPLEIVQEMYRTHWSRETARFAELVADDVEWRTAEGHPLAGSHPWIGREAVLERIVNPLYRDWDNYHTSVEELIPAADGRVISLGRYAGTYRPTGRRLDAEVCTVITVEDGRIARFNQFTDTAQFRQVMAVDGDLT